MEHRVYSVVMTVVAALHMACVIQQRDARQWFAELAVDLEKVCTCLLLRLYGTFVTSHSKHSCEPLLFTCPLFLRFLRADQYRQI